MLYALTGTRIEVGIGQMFGADATVSTPAVADIKRFGPLWSFGFGNTSLVDYAPDGKRIVASGSNVLFLIDAESYAIEAQWFGGGILSLKWSPDGAYIAVGAVDGVEVWDAETGVRVWTLGEPDVEVWSVTWSPDSAYIAAARQDIQIWEVATGTLVRTIPFIGSHRSVAWSPDGGYLALGTFDPVIRLWDVRSGALVRELRGHTGTVASVAWSPDGKYLASGADFPDGTTRVWDSETGRLVRTFPSTSVVLTVSWSPDGTYVAAGAGYIYIWNMKTGDRVRVLGEGRIMDTIGARSFAWSPDGACIVSGGARIVDVWNAGTGDLLAELYGHRGMVTSVAWHPEGTYLASGSEEPRNYPEIRIWDLARRTAWRTIPDIIGCRSVDSVDWSPDGKYLASANGCDMLRIWDPATGEEVLRFDRAGRSALWSPNGSYIASGALNRTILIWEVKTARLKTTLQDPSGLGPMTWNPDGKYMAAGTGNRTIRIFEIETGEAVAMLEGHPQGISQLQWSPDGKYLASSDYFNRIHIREVATGQLIQAIEEGSGASLDWSPDSRYLASSGGPLPVFPVTTINIWDVATGRLTQRLSGHGNLVTSVKWSHDGQYIASSSQDGSVRLWGILPEEEH